MEKIGWHLEQISEDWDQHAAKLSDEAERGVLQVWVLDLSAENWFEEVEDITKERAVKWFKYLWNQETQREPQLHDLLQNEDALKRNFENMMGIGLSLWARRYSIPFLFATHYSGHSEGLLAYISTGKIVQGIPDEVKISKEDVENVTAGGVVEKYLERVKAVIPGCSVSILSC
ncbi:MAG: hypothetical protein KAV87_40765, partial [Desulfobacteraceae bacterium]|nr:hypothetical protein [Desulfobacteraceae bacterium]